jgi:lysophospholipase L1-like esterase
VGRILLVVGLAAATIALVAIVVVVRDEDDGRPTGSLTMLGDSLNVGVEPYLREALDGWRVDGDNLSGRGSDDGIAALERLGETVGSVLVVSLGTNDPQTDVEGFRRDVERVLELAGPGRCVVWATIVRDGPNARFNEVLEELDDRHDSLRLVDWHRMVDDHPEWLTGDGVHGTPEGYRERARAVAHEAGACLPESTP